MGTICFLPAYSPTRRTRSCGKDRKTIVRAGISGETNAEKRTGDCANLLAGNNTPWLASATSRSASAAAAAIAAAPAASSFDDDDALPPICQGKKNHVLDTEQGPSNANNKNKKEKNKGKITVQHRMQSSRRFLVATCLDKLRVSLV